MEGLAENILDLEEPCPIYPLTKENKILRGPTSDVLKFAPEFMLQMDFSFSMLKASVDLPLIFRLYVLLLNTSLDFHPESNVHISIS